MLTVDEINTEAQFRSLEEVWNNLLKESGRYSPFLTHGWFRCCLGSQSGERRLTILIVREGATVLGIAPLWLYRDRMRGVPVRKVGFIASPESPFVDLITRKGASEATCKNILDYMFSVKKGAWDLLALDQWPSHSPNYTEFLNALNNQKRRWLERVSSVTPYLELKGSWESFLKGKSPRFRKTHRNIVNRIEKLENVEVRCIRNSFKENDFKNILAISEASWKKKAGVSICSDMKIRDFLWGLTQLSEQEGWLLVWVMKINDIPVAMEYDLTCEGMIYALRADFDEAYRDYSPGSYLEYQLIRYLFDNGYKEYSFGPGLNNYKLQWTDACLENIGLTVCNDSPKGLVVWILEKRVLPLLRRVRSVIHFGNEARAKAGRKVPKRDGLNL